MSIKQERVSGRIRKILSILILREVADPRLVGITITDVEIDSELLFAKVFVNALGEEERAEEILFALEHAKGFLRREVAKRVHLRKAPQLIFKWDDSLERGARIEALLNNLEIPPPDPADAPMAINLDDLDDDAPLAAADDDEDDDLDDERA